EVLAGEAELTAGRERSDAADLAEAVSRAERLGARASGARALLEQRARNLRRELAASVDAGVIASLEAEAARLAEQLAAVDEAAAGLLPEESELATAEAALGEETAEVEQRWGQEGPASGDPAAEVRGELSARRAAADRARAERGRLDARASDAARRVGRLEGEALRLAADLEAAEREAPALTAAAEAAAGALAAAEAEQRDAEERRRAADAEAHRWQARAEALAQALDEARARAGAERLAGVPGVVGTLLELVTVEPGWQPAFEAAAGEALAAVVVDGRPTAEAALAELRRQAAGGAVAPLPEPGIPGRAPPGAGGGEPVRAHVGARLPSVAALLDRLLAPAVCAPGWEEALALAASRPDLVVVTADGDRFSGGLWRIGVGGAGATGAALEEAEHRAADAASAGVSAAEALAAARERLARRRTEAADTARAAERSTARRRALADARARADQELDDARRDAQKDHAQRLESDARVEAESARIEDLEALLPALEAQAAAEAQRALAERAARSRLAQRAVAVGALRRDLEVRAAGVEERRSLLTGRLREVEERLARNVAERDEAAARRVRLAGEVAAVERLGALVADRESGLAGVVQRLRVARRAEADGARRAGDRLDGLRRQRATAERELTETRERTSRVELDETEARVRLEALTEGVRRDLECEPEATRDAPCPELPPGSSPASRRSELERELRLMGPINPLALEEFTALQERHTFLESQLDDVRSARRELSKVIRAVDAEIVEVFRAAYADVADNFERLFATLFPGGQGRLRLTDPDHLLETGIDIEARPSGKNVRRLSLLSGGERSLTAMAFLFAVFRSRPSPFYLLDEVEAALDDVNLHRFLDLVHEFRDEAQLVIVSHQKRTMEAADCLYGVTMPPGGSSRVISERVAAPAG
ncbi:MAG: coiled-coil domain-containing protein, partial [Acidimicrobiales bacterium]